MKRLFLLSILFCLNGTSALQAGAAMLLPETHLDRTAFFAGEPIQYRVRVRHDASIEFILDRFNEGSLRMEPFQVQQLAVSDSDGVLTVTMQLVSFEVARQKQWSIPSFNLYYTHKNMADTGGQSNVETLTVPATPIAFRSALPENALTIRDEVTLREFSFPFWTASLLGWLGLLATVIPLGRSAYRWARHQQSEVVLDRPEIRKRMAKFIRELPRDGARDATGVVIFYESLAIALRNYVKELSGKHGGALTAEQLEQTLIAAGTEAKEARQLAELVAFADQVRYSRSGVDSGKERLDDVREKAIRLFEN